MKFIPFLFLALFLIAGCTSTPLPGEKPARRSPTEALVRGELAPDEYLAAIKKANEEDRKSDQFELNKEPTRAYNTKTGKIEYVPEGTSQKWNEESQRWEFTPVN